MDQAGAAKGQDDKGQQSGQEQAKAQDDKDKDKGSANSAPAALSGQDAEDSLDGQLTQIRKVINNNKIKYVLIRGVSLGFE